jgi:hypothetical protein
MSKGLAEVRNFIPLGANDNDGVRRSDQFHFSELLAAACSADPHLHCLGGYSVEFDHTHRISVPSFFGHEQSPDLRGRFGSSRLR